MDIWLPDSIYRLFPVISIFSGVALPLAALSAVTCLLGAVLVAYGFNVLRLRFGR